MTRIGNRSAPASHAGEPGAVMRFRRRRRDGGFDRAILPLAPGAAYYLSGEARHQWEHSIVEMDRPRWSITFRNLSGLGRPVFEAI